jgi:hypothetical protein
MAPPAASRCGLSVAVTGGGDENVICVITESNDVAEAATSSTSSSPSTAPTPGDRPTS